MNNILSKSTIKLITVLSFVMITFIVNSQEKVGGLALYTLRNDMGQDVEQTLRKVAEVGYKNVEAAGYKNGKYYGMAPKDFKGLLKKNGLSPISTHQNPASMDEIDAMISDAKAAGFKYFVIPVPPMGMFKYDPATQTLSMEGGVKKLAEILTEIGEKCNSAGLRLLYHNHDFEFEKDKDGIVPIDYLLENVDPKLMDFQMDLYWVVKAKASPVSYFKKYPGRFIMWHVKDMDDQGRFAPVGNGNIDFAEILANKKMSGMKYYMVEQDRTFHMTPLEAIKVSHDAIKKIGFN